MKCLFRRTIFLLCIFFLLLSPAFAAVPNGDVKIDVYSHADKHYKTIQAPIVTLSLDGTPLLSDVPAVIWQNRTMLPVRLIGEALDAKVTWDDARNQVILRKNDATIILTLGSSTAVVNGKTHTLPDSVPATIMRLNGI